MQIQQLLLKQRFKWFNLSAKNFILRYQSGLFVLVMILPGVSIGDNFNLLFKALTSPFLHIINAQTSFISRLAWFIILQSIFVVFGRAQSTAITGGEFSIYMQSLPIDKGINNKINLILLLIANHFLWIIILASFYYQIESNLANIILNIMSNLMLVFILLTTQYIVVFKKSFKDIVLLMVVITIYISSISLKIEIIGLILTAILWFILVMKLSNPVLIKIKKITTKPHITRAIKYNLYCQMLFKATATATVFRLLFVFFLVFGFSLVSIHLANNNQGNIVPYALGVEALLAYYLSGFYVSLKDQRQRMDQLLTSLPVSRTFWFLRDVFTVSVISFVIHIVLFSLMIGIINLSILTELVVYHCVLLIICYPLRMHIKQDQTLITFAVLVTITAITIFNYP